jgi:zinc transport system permease protein
MIATILITMAQTMEARRMLDDFFVRALLAGAGVALLAGPLGCFIVWRRMAYFGDTLAHAALLGVALAFLLEWNVSLTVFLVAALIACGFLIFQRNGQLSSDAVLGLLSHSSLALGLVVLALMTWVRVDLLALLFGDVLAVSREDLVLIYGGGLLVLTTLALIWRPLLAATVNPDLAEAEGMSPLRTNIIFMFLIALVISVAIKVVGVLLITSLLVIPAAAARHLSRSPEQMALFAAGIGVVAVIAGLFGSLQWDTPSGPSIVVAAMLVFLVVTGPIALLRRSILNRNSAG